MLKSSILVAALAAAAGIQGPQTAPAPSPIPWSAKRSLSWSDYVGHPDPSSKAGALTVYRWAYQERCTDDAYTFSVTSTFLPAQSWVKPVVLASAEGRSRLLVHEQGHFDLSEVTVRKLRKALAELQHPCGMTAQARATLVQRYMRDDREEQQRYDLATNYGLNLTQQTRSVVEIGRQLASLSGFAASETR